MQAQGTVLSEDVSKFVCSNQGSELSSDFAARTRKELLADRAVSLCSIRVAGCCSPHASGCQQQQATRTNKKQTAGHSSDKIEQR